MHRRITAARHIRERSPRCGPTSRSTSLKDMPENFRRFSTGPDPFGRMWEAEFRWLQTAISIRHADTVDVKFTVWTHGPQGIEDQHEKIIALPNAGLLELAARTGHAFTDPWCMRLAARHLQYMISSGEDLEKNLVTLSGADLERASGIMQPV